MAVFFFEASGCSALVVNRMNPAESSESGGNDIGMVSGEELRFTPTELGKLHSAESAPGFAHKPAPLSAESSLIGATLDHRFRIIERLGKGGMSEVFKAEHLLLKKPVALKVLLPGSELKENAVERFRQEARAVSSLDHPNIVRVHAFGVSDLKLYLVMDYIEGDCLSELVEGGAALSWVRVVQLSLQITEGLAHAHERGIIHRDLKPSNIILQIDEQGAEIPKIVDFGIAKLTAESGKEIKQLTLEGYACGSPPYMSPEQVRGQAVDARSDIYSFGCMLYELLSGSRPFSAATVMEIMEKQIECSPEFFGSFCADREIPHSLEAIVRKCLAKDPLLRYQNMRELNSDLREIGSDSKIEGRLQESLKKELASSYPASAKNEFRKWTPALLFLAAAAAAGSIYFSLLPASELAKLKNELVLIKEDDPARLEKLMTVAPHLADLEYKSGNKDGAVLRMLELHREVEKLPPSISRFRAQFHIIRYLDRLGDSDKVAKVREKAIVQLEQYADLSFRNNRFAELEPAVYILLRLCAADPAKRDRVLGRCNLLASSYIRCGLYGEAEKIARIALQIAVSNPDKMHANEIIQLCNLASALRGESKFQESERCLIRAKELCSKEFASDSPIFNTVQKRLAECRKSK